MIFTIPSPIPNATPVETAYINVCFLKTPVVKFSTVIPSALSAGSARVAPNPRIHANATARPIPIE